MNDINCELYQVTASQLKAIITVSENEPQLYRRYTQNISCQCNSKVNKSQSTNHTSHLGYGAFTDRKLCHRQRCEVTKSHRDKSNKVAKLKRINKR